jgi:hypothetical protein
LSSAFPGETYFVEKRNGCEIKKGGGKPIGAEIESSIFDKIINK